MIIVYSTKHRGDTVAICCSKQGMLLQDVNLAKCMFHKQTKLNKAYRMIGLQSWRIVL